MASVTRSSRQREAGGAQGRPPTVLPRRKARIARIVSRGSASRPATLRSVLTAASSSCSLDACPHKADTVIVGRTNLEERLHRES